MTEARRHFATLGRARGGGSLVMALLLGAALLGITMGQAGRAPASRPVPEAPPAVLDTIAGVLHRSVALAPRRLLPDTMPPDDPVQLLWLEGRNALAGSGVALTLDDAGQLLTVDERLRPRWPAVDLDGRILLSAAPGPNGGAWLTDAEGVLLQVDSTGAVVRQDSTPFAFPSVASTPDGRRAYLVRSAQRFAYRWPDASAPLVVSLADGRQSGIGRISIPEQGILAEMQNAGQVATDGIRIFYAPFIRDEIMALSAEGDTLWVLHRQLPQTTRDLRFELVQGSAVINYHPVNLGLVIGPDARLYALSTPGFTMEASRVDQIDPASGALLASAELPTALPTLAADLEGRIYLLDGPGLISGAAGGRRAVFRPFDLPLLDGGTLSSSELQGSVVLVNFWASWCGPCRREMPALDSVWREFEPQGLRYASLNEERGHAAPRQFLAELGLHMPVALGDGALQGDYHLPGLPVTLLIDRAGRVAGRWIGGLTDAQLPALRAAIRAELAREAVAPDSESRVHHH